MAQTSDQTIGRAPHIPVLLRPLLAAVAPVRGLWLDGTFGAGGYTRGLLAAGANPNSKGTSHDDGWPAGEIPSAFAC